MAQSQTPVKGSDRVPLPGAKAIGAAHGEQWVEVTVKVKRKAELPDLTGRPVHVAHGGRPVRGVLA